MLPLDSIHLSSHWTSAQTDFTSDFKLDSQCWPTCQTSNLWVHRSLNLQTSSACRSCGFLFLPGCEVELIAWRLSKPHKFNTAVRIREKQWLLGKKQQHTISGPQTLQRHRVAQHSHFTVIAAVSDADRVAVKCFGFVLFFFSKWALTQEMESALILMYPHFIFLGLLGGRQERHVSVGCLSSFGWDVLLITHKHARTAAHTHRHTHTYIHILTEEHWRRGGGNWSAAWSWERTPMGLIRGMEQTAELIWDDAPSPVLLLLILFFLFPLSLVLLCVVLMKTGLCGVGGIQHLILSTAQTAGCDQNGSTRITGSVGFVSLRFCQTCTESYFSLPPTHNRKNYLWRIFGKIRMWFMVLLLVLNNFLTNQKQNKTKQKNPQTVS